MRSGILGSRSSSQASGSSARQSSARRGRGGGPAGAGGAFLQELAQPLALRFGQAALAGHQQEVEPVQVVVAQMDLGAGVAEVVNEGGDVVVFAPASMKAPIPPTAKPG